MRFSFTIKIFFMFLVENIAKTSKKNTVYYNALLIIIFFETLW